METTVTVQVKIPLGLRRHTGGAAVAPASGRTVGEVIEELCRQHEGLRYRILDGAGELLSYVNVYRNGEDVRYQAGLATPLEPGDRLQIIPAAAGG